MISAIAARLGFDVIRVVQGLILTATAILAVMFSGWAGLKVHDRKVASRVVEKSQSEAHKDVAIGKTAQSNSLSSSSGMRSPYRRD